jgi:hypothetical protein
MAAGRGKGRRIAHQGLKSPSFYDKITFGTQRHPWAILLAFTKTGFFANLSACGQYHPRAVGRNKGLIALKTSAARWGAIVPLSYALTAATG